MNKPHFEHSSLIGISPWRDGDHRRRRSSRYQCRFQRDGHRFRAPETGSGRSPDSDPGRNLNERVQRP